MLQGYSDAVLWAEALEEQLVKARKHSTMLQSKLDGAFAQYHSDVRDMQAKSDELVQKNKSLCSKNKGTVLSRRVPIGDVVRWSKPALLIVELETRVKQLKASEVNMKNLFYWEKEAHEVLEYDYKQLAYECDKHMELRIASDRDLVNCYKSLQKLNEDCEKLRAQLKELEEAALPNVRLLVPHPGL
jgi:hypothetical protein